MDVDAIGNRHIHRVSGEIANNADRYRRSRYDSTGRPASAAATRRPG